jgi:hypothetical protein
VLGRRRPGSVPATIADGKRAGSRDVSQANSSTASLSTPGASRRGHRPR